jgi:hypothetical protein
MSSLYRFILLLIVIFCGSALGVWVALYHAPFTKPCCSEALAMSVGDCETLTAAGCTNAAAHGGKDG